MKKCIVYYSKTGHTRSVVDKFNDFDIFEITAESDDPNNDHPVLTHIPDIESYGHVIFACPVHGFQMSKIMRAYMIQLKDLNHKVIDLFVTHLFRFSWLGGKQTLKQMTKIIKARGGKVRYQTSIDRRSKKSNDVMIEIIRKYSK